MDRFIGTGSRTYNRQQRKIQQSLSVPGSSSSSSTERIKNGFPRPRLNKKQLISTGEIGTKSTEEYVETYQNESISQIVASAYSPSLINAKSNAPIQSLPESQASEPVFVTFDNNAKFRIPILSDIHRQNKNSSTRDKQDIEMDIITHSSSKHPTNQEVNI